MTREWTPSPIFPVDEETLQSARIKAGIRRAKEEGKTIGGTWTFCFMDEVEAHPDKVCLSGPNRTKVVSREDVMDLASRGYSMAAAARELGVSRDTFRRAIERNGLKETYRQVMTDSMSNMVAAVESGLSEGKSFQDIAGEFGVPTSELRSWYRKGVKLLHPVGDEGFGDVSEDSEDHDSQKDDEVRSYREGLIRILSKTNPGKEYFIVRRPMLVMEGARLLASTVNDGADPDERIWSEKASRFVLPPLDLYMVEGTVRFGRGYIPVVRADIVPGSDTNSYQRGDDIYGEAGRLVLSLEGNASVTMPILTDYPIELRRKMIV